MATKIEKEMATIFLAKNSGTITDEEFTKLMSEILSPTAEKIKADEEHNEIETAYKKYALSIKKIEIPDDMKNYINICRKNGFTKTISISIDDTGNVTSLTRIHKKTSTNCGGRVIKDSEGTFWASKSALARYHGADPTAKSESAEKTLNRLKVTFNEELPNNDEDIWQCNTVNGEKYCKSPSVA